MQKIPISHKITHAFFFLLAFPPFVSFLFFTEDLTKLLNFLAYSIPIFIITLNSDKLLFKQSDESLLYSIVCGTVLIFLFSMPNIVKDLEFCSAVQENLTNFCIDSKTNKPIHKTNLFVFIKTHTLQYCLLASGIIFLVLPFLNEFNNIKNYDYIKIKTLFLSYICAVYFILCGLLEKNILHSGILLMFELNDSMIK